MADFSLFTWMWIVVVITQLSIVSTTTTLAGLEKIEHIIIFMQENRAFDHYFGTLRGVRGFNDRAALMLSTGRSVFYQPTLDEKTKYMLPFRAESNRTNAMCMQAPKMDYRTDIKIWNEGRFDSWNTARAAGLGMSYFTRSDIPYYYALYDAFTVGDHYYQSTFTNTNPNRMHLFTGSSGSSVGQRPVLDETKLKEGYDWETMGEILTKHGISWRVYQEEDNFDDNAFAWFSSFLNASKGDYLYDRGMAKQKDLIDAFDLDMKKGTLSQVSWIVAPKDKSEHAPNHPCAGEDYTARILKKLQAHPDVYAKSVFILNYDEGGQFYDHAWSPTPPRNADEGFSSVTVNGEINTQTLTDGPNPIGLGFRAPLLLISPWTRGNIVYSEVLDHTSVIKFIEKRFNVENKNLSPWRRMVVGDMTAAFDFDHPDYSWPVLPDTSTYVTDGNAECSNLPSPTIPSEQSMPVQEEGVRVSKALPYEFQVSSSLVVEDSVPMLSLNIKNSGKAGVSFLFHDLLNLESIKPQQYALAADDTFLFNAKRQIVSKDGSYAFVLYGPNGFLREFRGQAYSTEGSCPSVEAHLEYSPSTAEVKVQMRYASIKSTRELSIKKKMKMMRAMLSSIDPKLPLVENMNKIQSPIINRSKPIFPLNWPSSLKMVIIDNAYGHLSEPITANIVLGTKLNFTIPINASGNWYDFTVKSRESICKFSRRFMGRMETGQDSISDPAMGKAFSTRWLQTFSDSSMRHPLLSNELRIFHHIESDAAAYDKDARF